MAAFFYLADQFYPCMGIHIFTDLVAYVGNHAQQIFLIFVIELHGLIIVMRQQHLGSDPHSQALIDVAHFLFDQLLGLPHHHRIERGQKQRIVMHRIFHQQDHPHEAMSRVILHVHLVFHVFHHGQKQLGIAIPEEYVIDILLVAGVIFPDHIV